MLLEGKKLVITGVLTDDSIAFSVARLAQEQGAEIVLTSFGRVMRLTERVARKLPTTPDILELDVTDASHVPALTSALQAKWDRVDGVLHSIANANPATCLGGDMMRAGWDDVGAAIHVSAYSLKAVTEACLPLMGRGASVLGLDFDASQAWPLYDWMGVAKGRARIGVALPRARPRSEGHSRQPHRRRPAAHDVREIDPRVRAVRRDVDVACAARMGPSRSRAGRPRVRRVAVGLVPSHDRRDHPRRRRIPCRRRVTRSRFAPGIARHSVRFPRQNGD